MNFKEQLAHDNKVVFMNIDEFAEIHDINGRKMPCIIDNNEMVDREKRYQYKRSLYGDGIYLKEILFYVNARDFGPLPAIGRSMIFDGRAYTVSDAINEGGIYSLSIEANKV